MLMLWYNVAQNVYDFILLMLLDDVLLFSIDSMTTQSHN
jgi:hypothetical protein